MALISH